MSIYNWFEERLEITSISDDILFKPIPAHISIFYCYGGIVLSSFLIQATSGFVLTLFYTLTAVKSYMLVKSILYLCHLGWAIRSLHRWSSGILLLSLILHVCRVYLTGGFKRPRELTWVTGVVMAVITVSFGVTGYSLPWDQVGYWAVKIVSGVPAAIPVIGDFMVELLRGGESVGQSTLTRFYSLHTFVMPWLLAVFMLMHFLMIRKQGISGPL
jgi:cytochrome b6